MARVNVRSSHVEVAPKETRLHHRQDSVAGQEERHESAPRDPESRRPADDSGAGIRVPDLQRVAHHVAVPPVTLRDAGEVWP